MVQKFYSFLEVMEARGAVKKPSKCLKSKMNLRFTHAVVRSGSSFLFNAG